LIVTVLAETSGAAEVISAAQVSLRVTSSESSSSTDAELSWNTTVSFF
jgi:hypothetical protein